MNYFHVILGFSIVSLIFHPVYFIIIIFKIAIQKKVTRWCSYLIAPFFFTLMRICLSNLFPFQFFLKAEKKGASNTVIGMIFGCYALFELLASLFFGKYVSIQVHMNISNLKIVQWVILIYQSRISIDAEIATIILYELCYCWQFHS